MYFYLCEDLIVKTSRMKRSRPSLLLHSSLLGEQSISELKSDPHVETSAHLCVLIPDLGGFGRLRAVR